MTSSTKYNNKLYRNIIDFKQLDNLAQFLINKFKNKIKLANYYCFMKPMF